ncbi:MAG: hypothetical protein MJZ42_05665 [Bacteroidales bacterium]|nr:hypothetical protein [Bacteroidales bacterium]
MAILEGLIRKMSGSAGDFTFSQNQGRTIVSEKVTHTTNRRTAAQQHPRMRWANIVKMYKGIIPLLECAFENKAKGVSDFNMFMKLNMNQVPVYLTRNYVEAGACVVAPYKITQGSLPDITVTGTGANGVTDISLGSLEIDETTTVAQFANAVVQNNADFDYNDQISFFRIVQRQNNTTGVPYGIFEAFRVVLVKNSPVLLLSIVPAEGFTVVDGKLGHLSTVAGNYAYAWVHSRNKDGEIFVSSQSLIDNNALLSRYTSEDAYREAVNSYGGERNVFLSPSADGNGLNDGADDDDNDDDNENENPGGNTPTRRTLTLSVTPANGGNTTGAGQYDEGATATITAIPASGYTFNKWSDGNTNASRTITVNSDMTLTAMFNVSTPPVEPEDDDDEEGGDI